VRHFGSSIPFDFEVILYENGAIKVQMLDAGPELGSSSTTGIEDYTEVQGLTYACDTMGSVHDDLAVLFLPDGASWTIMIPSVSVSFAARLIANLPEGTPVTNTATLDNGYGNIYDLEAVFLARGSDLSESFKQVVPGEVETGDTVTYTVFVHNVGGGAAMGEMRDELPPELSYETGSLVCGTGSCSHTSGVISWAGTLGPRSMVPVRFRATLQAGAGGGGVITNTAVVTDVGWDIGYPVAAGLRPIRHDIYLPLVMRNR
jgi:uncharacterized repeat protein (TIGR01451 family)